MEHELTIAIQHAQRLPAHLQRQCAKQIYRFIEQSYRLSAQNDGDEIDQMDEVVRRIGEPSLIDVKSEY